jgi:hypothetical protein
MSWTYEIALRGTPDRVTSLQGWLGTAQAAFAGLPGLVCLDLYTPAEDTVVDPYVHDGAGPLMMLMLDFATCGALAAAVAGDGIRTVADALAPDIAATGAAFERRFYPAGGDVAPAPLRAPFSYVVRYRRPADDEAAFVRNYLASHPATEAKLPGIRNVICYLPWGDASAGAAVRLQSAAYMIGNEVVFEDVGAFNAAMASTVRHELRAHYNAFPRFTGLNTHDPMIRRRLIG